jgi:hypothetical protein
LERKDRDQIRRIYHKVYIDRQIAAVSKGAVYESMTHTDIGVHL